MAQRYQLSDGWHRLGPTAWTESCLVTLQIDLYSTERGQQVWSAVIQWWEAMKSAVDKAGLLGGGVVAYHGGARFPRPVQVSDHQVTAWIVSAGQDAFDSIADYAEQVYELALEADPQVELRWTELPHRDPAADGG